MKKSFIKLLLLNIFISLTLSILHPANAQVPVATLGPIVGVGPYGETPPTDALTTGASIVGIFSMFLGLMTIVGGLLTFAMFVLGGLSWAASGGDKANLEKARSQITNGIIGLVIIVASWAIIAMLGGIFGVNIIESQNVFQNLFQKAGSSTSNPVPTAINCPSGWGDIRGGQCCIPGSTTTCRPPL